MFLNFINIKLFMNEYISLGLLHFTLPTYNVFCTLPHQVQNRAMYPPSFIIACNVHFFKDDVMFLDGKACVLGQGQNGNFFLNLQPSSFWSTDRFFPYPQAEALLPRFFFPSKP